MLLEMTLYTGPCAAQNQLQETPAHPAEQCQALYQRRQAPSMFLRGLFLVACVRSPVASADAVESGQASRAETCGEGITITMATPVTPRPAATCVLMRPHTGNDAGEGVEVFMVRRHIQSEFAPDVYVFPGGSVNAGDRLAEEAPGLCIPAADDPLGEGFHVAALRECFEEAGVLLAWRDGAPLTIDEGDLARFTAYRDALQRRDLTMETLAERERLTFATDALTHWAHWITPEAFPKRFDTHFYLAEMPASQEAAYDHLETTDGVWITPEAASAGHEHGDFPLVFAQIHQLRELHGLRSVSDARARFAGRLPRTIMPRVVERGGAQVILLPDEA